LSTVTISTLVDLHQRLKSAVETLNPTTKPKPTIVVAASEKQLKLRRQERARTAQADTEVDPEIEAFFARNVRPGGALPPPRKR